MLHVPGVGGAQALIHRLVPKVRIAARGLPLPDRRQRRGARRLTRRLESGLLRRVELMRVLRREPTATASSSSSSSSSAAAA